LGSIPNTLTRDALDSPDQGFFHLFTIGVNASREDILSQLEKHEESVMKKILVVDDEKEILSFFKRFLKSLKYEPFVTDSWETAMDTFSKESFDLVILDVHMPGRDGFQVAKEMKDVRPDQQILIMTGLDAGEAYQYLRKTDVEVTEVIYKPFQLDKVRLIIEDILKHSKDFGKTK
jgi:DNA-binding NtrC family response regulator